MGKTCIIIISIVLICCTGCTPNKKEIKANAENEMGIITSGSKEEINRLIFGYNTPTMTDEGNEIIYGNNQVNSDNFILNEIFKKNVITINKVDKSHIEYNISAPDMSHFFNDIKSQDNITKETFVTYFNDYVQKTETKSRTVKIPYVYENGNLLIDYKNKDFLNGITGGLLESYENTYKEIIQNYQ